MKCWKGIPCLPAGRLHFTSSGRFGRNDSVKNMKKIKVCAGPVCKNRGAEKLKEKIETQLQNKENSDNINVEFCACRGNCEFAPNIEVNGNVFGNITEGSVIQTIKKAPEEKQEVKIDDLLEL
jgi:NADH:ubiquinone oxidoreductase subunit E